MKRLYCSVAVFLLFAVASPAQTVTGTVARIGVPVGFVRATICANGRALLAIPFHAFDPSIQGVMRGQMPPTSKDTQSVRVLKWDAVNQEYVALVRQTAALDGAIVETWRDESDPSGRPDVTLLPGEGFWLENNGTEDRDLFLCGEIVLDSRISLELHGGYNLVAYPFTAHRPLGSGIAVSDDSGEGFSPEEADGIYRYASNAYWAASLPAPDAVPVWQSGETASARAKLQMGSGYFYHRRRNLPATWTEERPYADCFASKDVLPAVHAMRPTPDGGMALTIATAGERGERLDLFYQDLTPSSGFSITSKWEFAVLDFPVNGASSVVWVDDDSMLRNPPGKVFGRCYAVACSILDLDGSGFPDGRELFLLRGRSGSGGSGTSGAGGTTNGTPDGAADRDGLGTPGVKPGPARRTVFVDARNGDDAFSGRQYGRGLFDGPKKTLRAGLAVLRPGDSLVISEGRYKEDLDISGRDVSVRVIGDVVLTDHTKQREVDNETDSVPVLSGPAPCDGADCIGCSNNCRAGRR